MNLKILDRPAGRNGMGGSGLGGRGNIGHPASGLVTGGMAFGGSAPGVGGVRQPGGLFPGRPDGRLDAGPQGMGAVAVGGAPEVAGAVPTLDDPAHGAFERLGLNWFPILIELDQKGDVRTIRMGDAAPEKP